MFVALYLSMNLAHNIADHLLQIKAVRLNAAEPFTWASGLRSPIYCDNRKALSHPVIRKEIVNGMAQISRDFHGFTAIAGVATAGIAWGALLADTLDLPFAYVRSKPKEHGLKNWVEGELEPGSQVLVVEDLVSTGGSSLDAIHGLEEAGYGISGLISIFQYGFRSATQRFEEKNLRFLSLSDFSSLLERALQAKYIDQTTYENLLNWNVDPQKWSDQFQLLKASL
jgi:orotate phosphoribosyltransferase